VRLSPACTGRLITRHRVPPIRSRPFLDCENTVCPLDCPSAHEPPDWRAVRCRAVFQQRYPTNGGRFRDSVRRDALQSVIVLRDARFAGRHSDATHFRPGESALSCVAEARIDPLIGRGNKTQVLVTASLDVVNCQLDRARYCARTRRVCRPRAPRNYIVRQHTS
jgi:hypothetical protein